MLGRRSVLAVLAATTAALVIQANAAEEKPITVFAAASMKNALDEVNTQFTHRSGIKVVVSYAASSALMKQIEQGAPADVFLSADIDWMDYGAKNNLINNDSRENLLGNRRGAISRIFDHARSESGIRTIRLSPVGKAYAVIRVGLFRGKNRKVKAGY